MKDNLIDYYEYFHQQKVKKYINPNLVRFIRNIERAIISTIEAIHDIEVANKDLDLEKLKDYKREN